MDHTEDMFRWFMQVEDEFDPRLKMTIDLTERERVRLGSCPQPIVSSDDNLRPHD